MMGWAVTLPVFVFVLACNSPRAKQHGIEDSPVSEGVTSVSLNTPTLGGTSHFVRVAPSESGISFRNTIDLKHPLKKVYITGFGGGGIAVGDLNNDDLPDLFFTSGPDENRLYKNAGGFRFEDVTASSSVGGGDAWGTGVAMADVDNDGDLDLYVCNYESPAQLFMNGGEFQFTESAASVGLDHTGPCMMPTFADYNRDGFLDVYLVQNRRIRSSGEYRTPRVEIKDGALIVSREDADEFGAFRVGPNQYTVLDVGQPDRLLQHNGSVDQPRYEDVTERSGITDRAFGLSAVWWDYDSDGFPDLYVANDFEEPDSLWRNNGDGTFTDILFDTIPLTSWFSMGADVGDINNDGHWDLLVADMLGTTHYKQKVSMGDMTPQRFSLVAGPPPQIMRNVLLLGTGTGRFLESAYLSGVAKSDWTWTVKFADLDNDGLTDLFFTNGSTRDFINSDLETVPESVSKLSEWDRYEDTPARLEQNLFLKNMGDLRFEDYSERFGLDHTGISYGAVHADLDRDGDLDLVVANLEEEASVYRNESDEGRSILVALRGTKSNSFGIGAEAELVSENGRQMGLLQPVRGFNSSNEPIFHFGLGSSKVVSELRIRWPSGLIQELANLEPGRLYTVTEPSGIFEELVQEQGPATLFHEVDRLSTVKHAETNFDDFALQPLLPNKLSQLGPGHAWGDIDLDGDDDLYVGGARGQRGHLFLNNGTSFADVQGDVFEIASIKEEMGAVS